MKRRTICRFVAGGPPQATSSEAEIAAAAALFGAEPYTAQDPAPDDPYRLCEARFKASVLVAAQETGRPALGPITICRAYLGTAACDAMVHVVDAERAIVVRTDNDGTVRTGCLLYPATPPAAAVPEEPTAPGLREEPLLLTLPDAAMPPTPSLAPNKA